MFKAAIVLLLFVNLGQLFKFGKAYDINVFTFSFTRRVVLTNGHQRIHLIGMSHLATEGFYSGVKEYMGRHPAAISLIEGISDDKNLLKDFNYKGLGSAAGLSYQNESITIKDYPGPVNADIDASEFSPETIEILNSVGEMFKGGDLSKMISHAGKIKSQSATLELEQTFDYNIITLRNQRLIKHLDDEIKSYDHVDVIIPWGSRHMDEIHIWLADKGFTEQDSSYHYTNSQLSLIWGLLFPKK